MKGSAGLAASICISASRGLLGLKRLFHPLPRCCNGSPPAFISAGLMLRPLMSVTGKVAQAGGAGVWWAERPLRKGFKPLSVWQLMRGSGERQRGAEAGAP